MNGRIWYYYSNGTLDRGHIASCERELRHNTIVLWVVFVLRLDPPIGENCNSGV